jgi:hypothetical protein
VNLRLRKIFLKEHERKKAGNAANVMVEED